MTQARSTITTLLLIGIATLIIMNIIASRRVRNLEMQLNNLHSNFHFQLGDVRHTNHLIWDISNRLDEVSEQVSQSTRLSFGEAILISRYHAPSSSADIDVSFSLRTHTPGDAVSITARGQGGQLHSAVATAQEGGRFTASINLPLHDNYVFTFTTTGDTVTTGELAQFDMADGLAGRFTYWLSRGHSSARNFPTTAHVHPYFENNTGGNPLLAVTDIALFIETEDGDTISVWDLTDYLVNTSSGQMLEVHYHHALVVGDAPTNIRYNESTIARLVIHDGLGVRYEQLEELFFPHQFGRDGDAPPRAVNETSVSAERPVRDTGWHWGRIRIVD